MCRSARFVKLEDTKTKQVKQNQANQDKCKDCENLCFYFCFSLWLLFVAALDIVDAKSLTVKKLNNAIRALLTLSMDASDTEEDRNCLRHVLNMDV